MVYKAADLIEECKEKECKISTIMRLEEAEAASKTPEELDEWMVELLAIMESSSSQGLEEEIFSISGMTGGFAKKVWKHRQAPSLSGEFGLASMARALSTSEVNASMGRIVAAPTAGASGILPAALFGAKEKFDLSYEDLVAGLYTAGAIGKIIALSATISGADGGCQAECGSASAMAAGALVELMGGTPEQSFHAASFALIHIMGLICDPIAGFVEFPCSLRNASGLMNAYISADLAMAGVESLVPFDEVVEAMYRVGKLLPESLRETALGGIAASEAAKKLEKEYL